MNMQYINFFILLLCCYSSFAQPKTSKELIDILNKSKSSLIQNVMNNKDRFKVQIIYTQINRDKNNIPHFTNFNTQKSLATTSVSFFVAGQIKHGCG